MHFNGFRFLVTTKQEFKCTLKEEGEPERSPAECSVIQDALFGAGRRADSGRRRQRRRHGRGRGAQRGAQERLYISYNDGGAGIMV